MRFEATALHDVFLVRPGCTRDERGYFALTWASGEFEAHGLNPHVVARNLSYNRIAGTLRGLHFQHSPRAEAKLVSVVSGAIFDVALDLRQESATFGKWVGANLQANARTMMYIPEGCAHGFITLSANTIVEYLISDAYAPEASGGVRWNDRYFNIRWPRQPVVVSARDRAWPDYGLGSPAPA